MDDKTAGHFRNVGGGTSGSQSGHIIGVELEAGGAFQCEFGTGIEGDFGQPVIEFQNSFAQSHALAQGQLPKAPGGLIQRGNDCMGNFAISFRHVSSIFRGQARCLVPSEGGCDH